MNVLLLPATETATGVADLLGGWSRAGLVRPFCLWSSDLREGMVLRLATGEEEEMPLGDALASSRPDQVEFVAFCPLREEETADPGFVEAVDKLLVWVRRRVLDVDEKRSLACLLAVAPQTAEQKVPPELFRANWTNLLVAPEDRAGPGAVNQLEGGSGSDERFLRHAAHSAVTAAAIWSTPEPQRPDLIAQMDDRLGPRNVEVRVMRCYSRVVELGHVADHIAGAVFEPRGGWPLPGKDCERAPDPQRLVGAAARTYLRRHSDSLGQRPFEPVMEEKPARLGLLEAFLALVDQIVSFVRQRPGELLEGAVQTVHDSAAKRIEALSRSTGTIHVKRWEELPEEQRTLAKLHDLLDEETVVTEDGDVSRAWTELRQTALGLVDGSTLPAEVEETAVGPAKRHQVVADPAWIARDPEGAPGEEAPEPLLQQVRAAVQAAKEAAAARADALAQPLSQDDAAAAEGEPERRRWSRWLRGGGLLLRLVRRALLYWLVAVIAVVLSWMLLPLLLGVAATAAVLLGWLYATARLARRALLRPRLPEDPRASRELEELNRALERAQALGDVRRLERRLQELDTWMTLLAELVHRPWVREPFEGVELVPTVDEESLPRACLVGVTRTDQEVLDRIGARSRVQIFRPGWLTEIFRKVTDLAMREYILSRGEVGPPPDPAADLGPYESSSRRALLEAFLRGEGRKRADNPIAAELLHTIGQTRLDELAPEVVPASTDARPLAPTATWVQPPPGVDAVAARYSDRLVGIRGWSATGLIVDSGLAVTAASAVERVAGVTGAGGEAIEVTGAVSARSAGLGVLHLAFPDGVGPGGDLALGEAPRPGDGVVALEAAPDGMKARGGYVTTRDCQEMTVVYDGGAPSLGAAIFDVRGGMVGVQGQRGELVPVTALETLHELEHEEAPPARNGAPGKPSGVPASVFLRAIAEEGQATTLQSTYWVDQTAGNNKIEQVLPPQLPQIELDGPVSALAGDPAYLRPLRVVVHRVEITAGVEPDELSASGSAVALSSPPG